MRKRLRLASLVLVGSMAASTISVMVASAPANAQVTSCAELQNQINALRASERELAIELAGSPTLGDLLSQLQSRDHQLTQELIDNGCFGGGGGGGGGVPENCGLPGASQDVLNICHSFLADPNDFASQLVDFACGPLADAFFAFLANVDPNIVLQQTATTPDEFVALGTELAILEALKETGAVISPIRDVFCNSVGLGGPGLPGVA